jgi:hypothetical protein
LELSNCGEFGENHGHHIQIPLFEWLRRAPRAMPAAWGGVPRDAKEHIEHAAHDFGGHRVEALKATDEAIRQLELCLKFDKD